ncbi:MAG TPA: DUF2066 domain-containing protein [Pseudomonadales bacterium]
MFALFVTIQARPLLAAEVTGLYESDVTVSSRDDQRELQQAFGTAMRAVLLKLTGRDDTNSNPVIARALSSPQSYVEAWAYNSVSPDDPFAQPGEAAQIKLHVTFFQAGVQQLLNEAGVAVWPPNRPDTLLWVAVQDELGERYQATALPEQGGDLVAAVEAAAAARGVPVLHPLQDFADLRALPLEQLWNLDVNALRIASSRYQSESILALRVFRSLSGDVIGKAVYVFRDRVLEFEALESPLQPFIEGSVDLVAESLASYYAILLSGAGNGSEEDVRLKVEGVGSASDYAGLLGYLNGLAVVSGVQVLGAQGATLELQLDTGGQSRQLVESIALDRRLTSLGDVTRNGAQVQLYYRWSPQP